MRLLQDHPRLLDVAWASFLYPLLRLFRRWLRPGGRMERVFASTERVTKGVLFNCQMCGDCVLESTGMTCPMTCPKELRNGPCGGVTPDGYCEVVPEMPCVWVQAWQRSKKMPSYGNGITTILPPLDRSLEGTSAWINEFGGRELAPPQGWTE